MDMVLLGGAAHVVELLKTWGADGVRALAGEKRKQRNGILAQGWDYVEELRVAWGVETVLKIANLLSAHNIHTPRDYLQTLLAEHGGVDEAKAEIARREESRLATMEGNRRTADEVARRAEINTEQRLGQLAAQARVVPETTYPPAFLVAREAAKARDAAAALARREEKRPRRWQRSASASRRSLREVPRKSGGLGPERTPPWHAVPAVKPSTSAGSGPRTAAVTTTAGALKNLWALINRALRHFVAWQVR